MNTSAGNRNDKNNNILLLDVIHALGCLAKVLAVVGEAGIAVQALRSLGRKQNMTRWELAIETDETLIEPLCNEIDKLPIVTVIGRSDRIFRQHKGGKIEVKSRSSVDNLQTLRDVYTPGVARVCLAIEKDPSFAHRYTSLLNTVAIVTNGTAILGLGDIGPVAGDLPPKSESILYASILVGWAHLEDRTTWPKKRHSTAKIINKLKEAEVLSMNASSPIG